MRIYGARMQTYLQDRAALESPDRFIDVAYAELVSAAPASSHAVMQPPGFDLPESSLQAMRRWEAANEQHDHGRHQYELADFGLSRDVRY